MKTVERYQADDGQEFRTAEECTLYERDKDAHALVGISLATMTAILDGAHGTEDLSLALRARRHAPPAGTPEARRQAAWRVP
jgi:hypothetical protein